MLKNVRKNIPQMLVNNGDEDRIRKEVTFTKQTKVYVVGGFNPFEKYKSNRIISPIFWVNK